MRQRQLRGTHAALLVQLESHMSRIGIFAYGILELSGLFRRFSLRHRLHRRLFDADQPGWRTHLVFGPRTDGGLAPAGGVCLAAQRHGAAGVQDLVEALRA